MDIYNLGKVDSTIDGAIGPLLYGFNIIGVHGRPLSRSILKRRPKAPTKRCEASSPQSKLVKPHVVP